MIGARGLRVAFGLVLVTSFGPAAVSEAAPSAGSTKAVTRVEHADNSASLTFNENGQNGSASSFAFKPGDPLTFLVSAFPPAPGSNVARLRVELFNNTNGAITFPGGLRVPMLLRNGQRAQAALVRDSAVSLAPGAGLQAETTSALRDFGQYSVSAFTVARF